MPVPETNVRYFEDIKERFGDRILVSNVYPATQSQIDDAIRLYEAGCCSHTIVTDERGWLYDFRSCAICGASLGMI